MSDHKVLSTVHKKGASMITKSKYNIALIAGYDVLADTIPTHRDYVEKSMEFVRKVGADIVFTLGGATNPDYPDLTEAAATQKILDEFNYWKLITIKIPEGNTPEESIRALIRQIRKDDIMPQKIIICAEAANLTGFLMDALHAGLLDLAAEGIYVYGHRFSESGEIFPSQRKKMLLHALSYRFDFFRILRLILQNRHQKKMAERKREENQ